MNSKHCEVIHMKRTFYSLSLVLLFTLALFGATANAAPESYSTAAVATQSSAPAKEDARDSAFSAHHGSWFNWVARNIFYGGEPVHQEVHDGVAHVSNPYSVYYDYLVISVFLMGVLGLIGFLGVRKASVRPHGKPTAFPQLLEAAVEGFHKYCISLMGNELAIKYSPLITSFFFTILLFNWIGLVPGFISPTTNPNVPFGLAIVGFFCVHFIAIREAGFKSYVMHYVGEPLWLAPLNVPLHIVGELVKPASLAMRLLGNIFGEETVIAQLAVLGIMGSATLHLPPVLAVQFPMMVMSVFFGLLQAIVFSTLLAIYISIFASHHDAHDEHNAHGSTEEVRYDGHREIVAHPSETTLA